MTVHDALLSITLSVARIIFMLNALYLLEYSFCIIMFVFGEQIYKFGEREVRKPDRYASVIVSRHCACRSIIHDLEVNNQTTPYALSPSLQVHGNPARTIDAPTRGNHAIAAKSMPFVFHDLYKNSQEKRRLAARGVDSLPQHAAPGAPARSIQIYGSKHGTTLPRVLRFSIGIFLIMRPTRA